MSEYRSKKQYNQRKEFDVSGDVRSLVCFCVDTSGSMTDPLTTGLFSKFKPDNQKIDLLSKVLKRMIQGFRSDPLMRHAAAISIVTYNQFAQVKEVFQDAALFEDLNSAVHFDEVQGRTNMTNGLNASLNTIREIQNDLMDKDQASYTPLLVFMTDGEPVGDDYWRSKFADIRSMVEKDQLHIFPIGIGAKARMDIIVDLFPPDRIPYNFNQVYCMKQEEDFERVFDIISGIVYKQNHDFVDEQRSEAVDSNAYNTQGGGTLIAMLNSVGADMPT